MAEAKTLISVGIPTYNRPVKLRELLQGLRTQTYTNVEIIVSDNCSTNADVQTVLHECGQADHRIKYFIQPKNTGLANNFQFVLEQSSGEFFIWMSDDDIPSIDFIEKTFNIINTNPDYNLVMGKIILINVEAIPVRTVDKIITIDDNNPMRRVYDYFKNLDTGGYFYGLYRTSVLKQVGYTNKMLGADILISVAMAFSGKIKVTDGTYFKYCIGAGASSDMERLASIVGLSWRHAAFFGFNDTWCVCKTIIKNPIFKQLSLFQKLVFCIGCGMRMLRYTDAFYASFVVLKRGILRKVIGRQTLRKIR